MGWSLSRNGQSIELPPLGWQNELEWAEVAQEVVRLPLGGVYVAETVLLAGRPVHLTGGPWVTRQWLLDLRGWLVGADPMSLTLYDGRVLAVKWDYAGPPISARLLRERLAEPPPSERYSLDALRFITV